LWRRLRRRPLLGGGKWEFPGGKQEPGETPGETIVREFAEELSVQVSVGDRLFVGSFTNGSKTYRLEAWTTRLVTREFRLADHDELRWVALPDLVALDLSDSDRQVAEALGLPRAVESLG